VNEETLTGRPHETSVQKATSDNENVDAVLTSSPGHHSVWMQFGKFHYYLQIITMLIN